MPKSVINEKSPYENINNSSFSFLKTPQSPRTQIRTMLPSVNQEQRDNEQLLVSYLKKQVILLMYTFII